MAKKKNMISKTSKLTENDKYVNGDASQNSQQ